MKQDPAEVLKLLMMSLTAEYVAQVPPRIPMMMREIHKIFSKTEMVLKEEIMEKIKNFKI